MAEQRAAGRAEVEKNEPPEPEQPPTPAPEEKAVGEKGPAKKDKAAKEKTPEPDKSKGRRGRRYNAYLEFKERYLFCSRYPD